MFKASRQQRRDRKIRPYRGPKIRVFRNNTLQKFVLEIQFQDGSKMRELYPLEAEMALEMKRVKAHIKSCVEDVNFEPTLDL